MRSAILTIVLCALCATTGLPLMAEDDPYVYTNRDLERMFGPPVDDRAPLPAEVDEEDWDYVIDFIERQRAKLEAQRDYELDRDLTDAETNSWRRVDRDRYRLGFYPWQIGVDRRRTRIGGNGHRHGEHGPEGAPAEGGPRYVSPSKGPAGRITPIHARKPLR